MANDITTHDNANFEKGFQKLFSDFETLFRIKDPLRRKYELIERAKEYQDLFYISSDEYYDLFNKYCLAHQAPNRIEAILKSLKFLASTLQNLAFLGIFIGIFQFIFSVQDRQVKNISENWNVIKELDGQPIDGGRKSAIEYLHGKGELLYKLPLSKAPLPWLNLPPIKGKHAELQGSNFIGAMLTYSYFVKANLAEAKFAGANMDYSNLNDSNLNYANFQGISKDEIKGASLKYSCLQNAKLTGARFSDDPNLLQGADFGEPRKNLTLNHAFIVDKKGNKVMSLQEWIQTKSIKHEKGDDGHGCNVRPRETGFWNIFKSIIFF